MPRDGKDKTPSAKTASLRKSNEFTDHLFRKLCNEQVFPKRSRWLFSGKIADLANDYMTCINLANEIRVVTPKEREARHYYLTMALARLQALDAGKTTMEYIRTHYQCFIARAEYCSGDGAIRSMDRFYTELFREKPTYKRKRRYLHGRYSVRKRAHPASRKGEGGAPEQPEQGQCEA